MSGQGYEQLTLFPGDSRASRTVSSERGKRKMMKDTCGRNSCGLSGKSNQSMLLGKMLMAYYQQYMSLFAPTWKMRTTKSGRTVYRLALSGRTMKDTGFVLLASPRASQDYKPIRKQTPSEHNGKHGQTLCSSLGIICPERIGQYINPQFVEWLMGFPAGWADTGSTKKECSATEMQ